MNRYFDVILIRMIKNIIWLNVYERKWKYKINEEF